MLRWILVTILGCVLCSFDGIADLLQADELRQFARQQLTGTYFSEGVAVGDVNGDGKQDVVYGPHWYAGPDFLQRHEIYPAIAQPMEKYANNFFAWLYDFNGDQANDLLVVGFPGTAAYVYQNPGNGQGQWIQHQVFDWVSNESPQLIDIVGDSRPELVCSRDGMFGFAVIDFQQPFSPWRFFPVSEKITDKRFGHGLGVGDVDGDGLQDMIFASGWLQQPKRGALDGRWLLHEHKFSSAYGGAEMFVYDVDGDGLNDIITSEAAHDFGLSWYKQVVENGQQRFDRQVIMGSQPSDNAFGVLFTELHSVRLADMDGDGLQDIVTGKTYYSHHRQSPMWDAGAVVYWFKLARTSNGVEFIPYLIDDQSGIGRQVVVADIDADGLPDVATGGMLGANVMLQKIASVSPEQFQAAQPQRYVKPKSPEPRQARRLRGSRNPVGTDGHVAEALEGESLKVSVSGGATAPQSMKGFTLDRWSGDGQLWWTGAKPGDRLSIELDVMNEVEALQLTLTCARDYGIFQVSLDGNPLSAPIDLYEPEVVTTGLIELETGKLSKGKHSLAFEVIGCNEKAVKQYMLGIDFLRFRQSGQKIAEATSGVRPVGEDGHVLNLDFETGTLADWTATGSAFDNQPIQDDTVALRRTDSVSQHQGRYWIGGYEKLGDRPQGTLTSAPFRASAQFASFLVGGGSSDAVRVELWIVGEEKPFFIAAGKQIENLSQVVVDLRRAEGKMIFIRLVDDSSGGWGHLNFDDFLLHDQRPGPISQSLQALVNDDYPHAGLSGEKAAKAMTVPEGFGVINMAAEPDVQQPIAMAMDDRGRIWIAEAYEYPIRAQGEQGRDRILIFEDTDGDGKLDSRKLFFEGLNLVSGLEVGFGGVWVGAAPYLIFIPDANGDDSPDGPPQILLDGWGYQDTHETLNTFSWGPDGWLYGCHGVFTHSKVGQPDSEDDARTKINAGIWRYHPTQHRFEVFAHGTSNPWGFDFNQMGDAFSTACVIPHLFHIIPGARYNRQAGQHFNLYTYADIPTIADHLHYLGATPHSGNSKSDAAGGGHAHAGAMVYQGGAWPKQYHGALLMNNIHGQRLNMDWLVPERSGYIGKHGPDFLLTHDQASQILNMQYGPDGNVVFIDWYDMQACHRKEVEVHDRSNGRIHKVFYGQLRPAKVDLAQSSDLELAEMSLHVNEWFVRHSRRLLQERAGRSSIAEAAIAKLKSIATSHAEPASRLRALWALYCIHSTDGDLWALAMQDPSPHIRAWSLRLQMQTLEFQPTDDLLERMVAMANTDDSPVLRLSLASIATRMPAGQRWSLIAELVTHAEDAKDHNLPLIYWYAMEPLADLDADRALALGIAAGESIPLLREFMLRRIAGSGTAEAIERLTIGLLKVDSVDLQQPFLKAIRTSLAGQRLAPKPAQWDAAYARLMQSNDAEIVTQAIALGVTFGDPLAIARMRSDLLDASLPEQRRMAALDALLASRDEQLVEGLLSLVRQPGAGLRGILDQAIRGLAQYDHPQIASTLIESYAKLSESQRRAAMAALCSRASGAAKMLEAIANKQIPSVDLSADLARQLEYLGDANLLERLGQVWGQVRKSSQAKFDLINGYRQLIQRRDLPEPDLALGRALFAKTCQRCHVLYGIGQQLGPDLTGSNRANLDYLLENIVDPSAVMAKEYRQSIIMTDSGQIITGIVRTESENAVSIQTVEATIEVPRAEIESRQESDLSMMPDDQLNQFTEHQLRSLMAYLRGKSQSPILATQDNSALLFNGSDLQGWTGNRDLWTVDRAEIVGRSQGLEENHFLVSDLLVRDFKLTLEVLLVDNLGNSGIQFRSQVKDGTDVSGYQADIGPGWWGKLYEEHGRALLWKFSGEPHVLPGQWNRYEVQAEGSRLRTWINGKLCVDLDDPEGAREGILALQLHSGGPTEVRFRNLRLEVK